LDQLFEVACYELQYTFLKVGCAFLWQQIGLAMGGFLSPPMAMATCSVAEFFWLRSLGADRCLVAGMRYMDDSTLVIASDSSSTATRIIDSYRSACYPDGLVLECTGNTADGELEILECMVSLHGNQLRMRHRSRNAAAARRLHQRRTKLPFKKVVPYQSAVPVRVKQNAVVGMLHRLEMNTSRGDWSSVAECLLLYQHEYLHLGYPKLFIMRCLKRVLPSLMAKDARWVLVAAAFSRCIGHSWRPWHNSTF